MKNLQDFFEVGMDRKVPDLITRIPEGFELNLGCGNKKIENARGLDLPKWNADQDDIPYDDGSVSRIYAFHFFEHLYDPIRMIIECQRVLMRNGVLNIVVPYYTSQMTADDLDHKKTFCEGTWKTLFQNKYYNKNAVEWHFEIGTNIIMGVVERNLALFTQLVRT